MKSLLHVFAAAAVLAGLGLLAGCGSSATSAGANPGRLSGTSGGLTPMVTTRQVSFFTRGTATSRAKADLVSGIDVNSNQAFVKMGFDLPPRGLTLEYTDKDEPHELRGSSLGALRAAARQWKAVPQADVALRIVPAAGRTPDSPVLDGHSVIGWGKVADRKDGAIAQVTAWFVDNVLIEADVALECRVHWALNAPITPNADYTAVAGCYDLQSVMTTQLGHVLGLGSVESDGDPANGNEDDATMSEGIGYGELWKQTLTPGDIAGLLAVGPLR